jgi:hypothetical protein
MTADEQPSYAVSCNNCEYIGDEADDLAEAVKLWNADAKRSIGKA